MAERRRGTGAGGRWVRRAIPALGTLLFVGYLVATTDLARAWHDLRSVPLVPFALVAVVGVGVGFLYDTLCLSVLLRRFLGPIGFREVLPLRGASYFLNMLNYNAASGGMALYLHRTRRVPFLEAASPFLFLNVIDVMALGALLGGGLVFGGDVLGEDARSGIVVALVVIALAVGGTWLYWNAGLDFVVLGRLRTWRIFRAFREARLVDYATLTALRIGFVTLDMLMFWAFFRLFGIEVPLGAMFALHPVITFIWTVPVNIAGLGTTQVAMRFLFGPYATYLVLQPLLAPFIGVAGTAVGVAGPAGAAAFVGASGAAGTFFDAHPLVDAASTSIILATLLVRILIGYASLRRASDAFLAAPTEDERRACTESADGGPVLV